MASPELLWDDLRVLLALHRHASHARAAKALGVDATTIGRKLRSLEETLGAKLVHRRTSGHVLTPVAQALLPNILRMEEDATAIGRTARRSDSKLEGTVRVTAGDGALNYVIVPALPALRTMHPDLTVHLLGDTRVLDLTRREADIAVRLVRPEGASLVVRRLPPRTMGIFAGEPYIARRKVPLSTRALTTQDWLDYDEEAATYPQVRWLRRHIPPSRIVLRGSTTTTLVRACQAGLGLAILDVNVGQSESLVRVLPQADIPQRDAWLVYHQDDRENARVRAIAAWLTDLFGGADRRASS